MNYFRIYTDAEGETHFEDIDVAFKNGARGSELSELIPATGVIFRRSPADQFIDWHPAPRRQFVITLSGEAEIEASKAFAKGVMDRHGVPTARARICRTVEEAEAAVAEFGVPVVVKADGLAAGKGVTIADTREAAAAAIDACFSGTMGDAGVVIEEFLDGEEASFFALVDGTHAIPFASAQDHKRAFDGDRGPNTGGMGAYSPAPVVTPEIARRAMDEIVWPTVRGMAARGTPYKGMLYAGLMIAGSMRRKSRMALSH